MNSKFLLVAATSLLLSTCKKEDSSSGPGKDTTKPVITLNGSADMNLDLGSTTADPGATATDNVDGDISSKISSDWNTSVDNTKTGNYTVTYSVSDQAGNKATATRKVNVKFSAGSITGTYDTQLITPSGTSSIFTSTVSAGSQPGELIFYYVFAAFTLHANLSGPLLDQITFNDNSQASTVAGTGTISEGGRKIVLNGTISNSSGTYPFTETRTRK